MSMTLLEHGHTDTSFDCDFNHVKAWVVTKAQRSQRYRAMLRVIK